MLVGLGTHWVHRPLWSNVSSLGQGLVRVVAKTCQSGRLAVHMPGTSHASPGIMKTYPLHT